MSLHTEFLVHWTGNNSRRADIESLPKKERPERYLSRLLDYYENGLFAKRTTEEVVRLMIVKRVVRLCFTEIRLSRAALHSDRYGRLGVAFSRSFIISKGGRPVVYIPYQADPSSRLLEDSIKYVHDHSEDDPETHRAAKYIMAHVKRMGNKNVSDECFEEMEWRIVFDEGRQNTHFSRCDADQKDECRLKFGIRDVKLIVLPDEITRKMALQNKKMQDHFSEHTPILVTLDDCAHF